ncbi:MAG: hypothetical protein FJ290_10640 [Planctomycetes bacterium]|nr:hypothetical protein [Planctomycetota bacterium]
MALSWRRIETADGASRRPRWSKRALVILGLAILLTWVLAVFAALRLDRQRRGFEEEAEAVKAEIRRLVPRLHPPDVW